MRKFITIFFFSSVLFLSTQSIADTRLDCSKYSTKTLKGLTDKIRCKKGLDPRKENNISFEQVKNKMISEDIKEAKSWGSIKDIPRLTAFEIIDRIQKKSK